MTVFQRRLLALLAGLGFAALYAWFYRQALWTYFSQDDFPLLIGSRPGLVPIVSFFKTGGPGAYRPVTQHFYFYINQILFDLNPVGHHFSNLLVHFCNALLVGWLAGRWIAKWTLLPAAFLYAFHPVHFYEVYWISGISQSGYLFFLLSTLACFSLYRMRGRAAFAAAAWLTALLAFFSKEDSAALPAILTLSALLPIKGDRTDLRRRLTAALPFWVLAGLFWAFRFWVVGFGLPSEGVYIFSFDFWRMWEKLATYCLWLFRGQAHFPAYFGAAFGALLACTLALTARRNQGQERQRFFLLLLGFAGMGLLSAAPSFLIPSSVDYYLSFSAAALSWVTLLLLSQVRPSLPRAAATSLVLLTLLAFGRQVRDYKLSLDDPHSPLPRKAVLCRKWVQQLRRQPPPPFECSLLFRDLPLIPWEKDWFIYLPMFAWDRIYPRIQAHTREDPDPVVEGLCIKAWSFASGDARPVPAG